MMQGRGGEREPGMWVKRQLAGRLQTKSRSAAEAFVSRILADS